MVLDKEDVVSLWDRGAKALNLHVRKLEIGRGGGEG